jgi:hypothetical protein
MPGASDDGVNLLKRVLVMASIKSVPYGRLNFRYVIKLTFETLLVSLCSFVLIFQDYFFGYWR